MTRIEEVTTDAFEKATANGHTMGAIVPQTPPYKPYARCSACTAMLIIDPRGLYATGSAVFTECTP